jgi:predicted outer membrane protein
VTTCELQKQPQPYYAKPTLSRTAPGSGLERCFRVEFTADLRDYPHLMVVTHIPVVDGLNSILQRKRIPAPPETLLQGAYNTMIDSLKADTGAAFDRDYVQGQVDYQKGNAALFRYEIQNGVNHDLKEFAERTSLRSKITRSGR